MSDVFAFALGLRHKSRSLPQSPPRRKRTVAGCASLGRPLGEARCC